MAVAGNLLRSFATHAGNAPTKHFKVLVVGAGSGGITAAAQLLRDQDLDLRNQIGVLDASSTHHYQPGWTLVGANVADMLDFSRPMSSVVPSGAELVPSAVATFAPTENSVKTVDGQTYSYDWLIVAPGIQIKPAAIEGLSEALEDPRSTVSSIYIQKYATKLAQDVGRLEKGRAIFTQPAGVIKCAGAPQKAMWKSLQRWREAGLRDHIEISFITGMPTMFSVPKYSRILDEIRKQRGVEGLFNHDLVSIDRKQKVATFKAGESKVERPYDLLHVTPKMGPWDFVAKSPLADPAGYVDVDKATLQHKQYKNVFSLGDASSLPTSKTAAAITSQAPVLVHNLKKQILGKPANATYTGYTSCPLTLDANDVLLAEFRYDLIPDETFTKFGLDQSQPQKLFYRLKKDIFPRVYFSHMLQGRWFGRHGVFPPQLE